MKDTHTSPKLNNLLLLGLIFILTGFIIFLDNLLRTGWLVFIILPLVGVVIVVTSVKKLPVGYTLAGNLTAGVGWLLFFLFNDMVKLEWESRVGYGLVGFGLSWLAFFIIGMKIYRQRLFWTLIPSGLIISVGLCFWLSSLRFVDFVLFTLVGLGISLLAWGIGQKLFGLIIPGSLLVTIGPGIYFPWGEIQEPNGLSQTGMMLVIFALGWGLIILFSRLLTDKFTWWPLIPGGILAVVGWGLYIGGNPQNAISFIGNTGSLGLMIFGFYLLLMRRGFRQ